MRLLLLAVLCVLAAPAPAGPSYRYDSGQTLTTIVVDTLNAPSYTITVPAGRVFTIVGWHGEEFLDATVTVGGLSTAGQYNMITSDAGAYSNHYSSFVLAGPATLTLSKTSKYQYVTVLTYALTRARTANP